MQQKVWSGSAFGDFEHSLNIAINKIRQALGDSADKPRFVETVPRRGYRFIAPVEGGAAAVVPVPVIAPTAAHLRRWLPLSGAALVVVAVFAGVVLWILPPSRPRLEWRRLTNDASSKNGPVLSDGSRLYFRTGYSAGDAPLQLVQIPASGGAPRTLPITPPPAASYQVLDITSDGQGLLLVAARGLTESNSKADIRYLEAGPLWSMGIADGSSRRVGNLVASDARYSPDGKQIAFAGGGIFPQGRSGWRPLTDRTRGGYSNRKTWSSSFRAGQQTAEA